ncbi:unnamed protein product [Musa hybrid cultivar]
MVSTKRVSKRMNRPNVKRAGPISITKSESVLVLSVNLGSVLIKGVSEPPTAKSNQERDGGEMLRSSASSLLRPRRFSSLADGSFGGDASSSVSEKIAFAVLFERLPVVIPKTDPVVYAVQELSLQVSMEAAGIVGGTLMRSWERRMQG